MKVYNTMNRKKEELKPLKSGRIGMYVCGVTVYDYCHIGHARSILVFDMICRHLKRRFKEVVYVRNFTDIDDKIIKRANEEGKSYREIAERYIEAFYQDVDALGTLRPDVEPKATEHIPEMIELIKRLEEKKIAYVVNGDVYYEVRKFPAYGKLSGRSLEEMMAGARIDVDEKKKDPLDFALWKASKPGEPWWNSPWGKGRPGWHIECSAMSMKYLGETFDIHGGGMDLIFPHHENEIAQSEAATGKPFVMYWIHNGFVKIKGEKMSKSLGNIILIRDILKRYDPELLRLFLLKTHYRSPIDFTFDALEKEKESLDRLYRAKEKAQELAREKEKTLGSEGKRMLEHLRRLSNEFEEAMDDDFNTALALGKLYDAVREFNRFIDTSGVSLGEKAAVAKQMLNFMENIRLVFGILRYEAHDWFKKLKKESLELSEEEIEELVKKRAEARKKKDYKEADRIRDYLKERGIVLEDRPDGSTVWRIAK